MILRYKRFPIRVYILDLLIPDLLKSYRLFISVLTWHSLSRGHHFYLPYPPLLRTPDAKINQKRIKTLNIQATSIASYEQVLLALC